MKALFTHRRRLAAMAMAVLLLLICPMSASAEVFSAIITANTMPVYGEMALTTKLGSLEKDTVVRVVGFSNSVAKISYRGYTGFAKISDMKTVDEVAKKAVTANAATVYEFEDHQGRSARSAFFSSRMIGRCWGQCFSHFPHPTHWEANTGSLRRATDWK